MDTQYTPIRAMEPKIIDRLRLVFPTKLFTIERVPPTMSPEEFKSLTRLSPYIGLAFTGFKIDPNAGRAAKGTWNWSIVFVCKATGNFDRRAKGDIFDLGLDEIMDVAGCILHGVTFDDIGLCSVTSSDVIYSEGWGKDAYVLAHLNIEIQTTMMSGALEIETLEDFAGINATWLMPEINHEKKTEGATEGEKHE